MTTDDDVNPGIADRTYRLLSRAAGPAATARARRACEARRFLDIAPRRAAHQRWYNPDGNHAAPRAGSHGTLASRVVTIRTII